MGTVLEFLTDPVAFLERAGDLLAADPVRSTVVTTVTDRIVREDGHGVRRPAGVPWWWLTVREDGGRVLGAAMRTAAFWPYAPYLLAMPEEAAVRLARLLHERAEPVAGLNGAVSAVTACVDELARLRGGTVRVGERTRLFELAELTAPTRPVSGGLRPATESAEDVRVALGWYGAFAGEAAAQAGRTEPHPGPVDDETTMRRRIRDRRVWLWVDAEGVPVHVTGVNPPSLGVARIGPVYTPPEHRGRGYAGAAVHELSRRFRADGVRVCLFTDPANPTSNALYRRLGYRPVEDQVALLLE